METKTKHRSRTIFKALKALGLLVMICCFSCGEGDDCAYTAVDDLIPIGCTLSTTLNLSTGIDNENVAVTPGLGVIDSYWKVLNNPPLLFCDNNPIINTINGSAYLINFGGFGPDGWVNQTGATTLAPMDLGTNSSFGCNNATNSEGDFVPYVFERSFCVIKDTQVDFNFSFKGDDQLRLELIDNFTNAVVSQSTLYIYPAVPMIWTETNLTLDAGSYSIRGYLANTSSVVLGFSMLGSITTTAGDEAISNNNEGCCQNNTISILNIIDTNCNQAFDILDGLGKNWTVNIKDSANITIRTGLTDANGNIFFAGISNGTYTVQLVPQTGFTTATSSFVVTVANNTVKIVEFFSCPN